MFALVDAVAFYASAEKVFDPQLRQQPVVVLTNNDGCICAVCPIARRFGIPKFEPYFKVKPLLDKHNIVVRSSNYELYADLSDRMMAVIGRFSDNSHIYSIDESFLQFSGFHGVVDDWAVLGQTIRRTVWRETKLPVGVGFGSTATLAKAANHAAKKFDDASGVAVIDKEQTRQRILKNMAVSDVWGVGKRLTQRLNTLGIHSAWDLACQDAKKMRSQFSVVLARTIRELNGEPCLGWDTLRARKKEIYSTRSFGERVSDPQSLKAALISHCTSVAKKLRQQGSLARRLVIFAHSSPYDEGYFKKSYIHELHAPSQDVRVFAEAVEALFHGLFHQGVQYHKCGVGAIELEDCEGAQQDLFYPSLDNPELMACMDAVNSRYGDGTVALASAKRSAGWHMRRDFLSPRYTTHWPDIPIIKCQ